MGLTRLGVAALMTLIVTGGASGCLGPNGDSQPPHPPPAAAAPTTGPSPAGQPASPPGLSPPLGLAPLDGSITAVHGSTTTFQLPVSCANARQIIDAGQWRTFDLVGDQSPFPITLIGLVRQQHEALLQLIDDTGNCTGEVTTSLVGHATFSGAITASGASDILPMWCNQDLDGASVTVAELASGPGPLHLSFSLSVPGSVGRHDLDDDFSINQFKGGPTTIQAMAAFFTAAQQAGGDDFDYSKYGDGWNTGDATTGSVTVDAVDPMSGTIEVHGLENDSGKRLNATLPFACTS